MLNGDGLLVRLQREDKAQLDVTDRYRVEENLSKSWRRGVEELATGQAKRAITVRSSSGIGT